jgi:hypothetical protein
MTKLIEHFYFVHLKYKLQGRLTSISKITVPLRIMFCSQTRNCLEGARQLPRTGSSPLALPMSGNDHATNSPPPPVVAISLHWSSHILCELCLLAFSVDRTRATYQRDVSRSRLYPVACVLAPPDDLSQAKLRKFKMPSSALSFYTYIPRRTVHSS